MRGGLWTFRRRKGECQLDLEKEYFVMDETDAPFEGNNLPYKRTVQDDIFLIKLAEKFNLELDPESNLFQLKQSMG